MKTVLVETWNPPGLCRGHAEIRYARNDCGWIEVHKALGEYEIRYGKFSWGTVLGLVLHQAPDEVDHMTPETYQGLRF